MAQFGQIASRAGVNAGTAAGLAGIKQAIAADTSVIDSLDSSAPSEIASALHTLRTALDQANTQAQGATTLQQLGAAFSALNDPAVRSASTAVGAYAQTSCGISASSSST